MQNATLQDKSSPFTDYRLSVHCCIDCIANMWEERSINRTVITAVYTQCDHDIIIMHTYGMQQSIDYSSN